MFEPFQVTVDIPPKLPLLLYCNCVLIEGIAEFIEAEFCVPGPEVVNSLSLLIQIRFPLFYLLIIVLDFYSNNPLER